MNLKEFVRLNPKEIRRDSELMQLFVNFYEAAFFVIPKCVGCSFKSGFKKLRNYANNSGENVIFDKTISNMKTFKLKSKYKLKILTYKKDGKTFRKYGHALTEEFAVELVAHGKSDVFSVLPESKEKYKGEKFSVELRLKDGTTESYGKEKGLEVSEYKHVIGEIQIPYEKMDYRKEVLPLYAEVKERTGKKADSNKKVDIIKFLQDNES